MQAQLGVTSISGIISGSFVGSSNLSDISLSTDSRFSFNETLFSQLNATSKKFGGGYYNATSAAEVRYARILDSMARNVSVLLVLMQRLDLHYFLKFDSQRSTS